jgi:hypothetical protein
MRLIQPPFFPFSGGTGEDGLREEYWEPEEIESFNE